MHKQVIDLPQNKKIYFASDFHLGAPHHQASIEREKRVITWLDHVKKEAYAIYLVGDIFDFWFEYKHAIPKGFIRLQGKLAELHDEGIIIALFSGNHDMWMFHYFQQEIGIQVYHDPIELNTEKHTILVGHGDGLGPGERGYKILKKIYTNSFLRWAFAKIHPDVGIAFAKYWSNTKNVGGEKKIKEFKSKEREQLFLYCTAMEQEKHHDFYIFGHRHFPLNLDVNAHSRYINLGDWMSFNTYAVYDGNTVELITFTGIDT